MEKKLHEFGHWKFNYSSRELYQEEQLIKLTTTESQLLKMFCESPEKVLIRDQALKQIWGDDYNLHGRSLNVYISRLRGYFKEDKSIDILNVHGVGYRLIIK